jgi:Domain of unknown function (DUF4262)
MPYQFEWRQPEEEADEILFRNVRTHGCHIIRIPSDEQGPGYAFSIGLFANYCHAELIVFGVDRNHEAGVINDVRDRVAAGRTFAAGDVCGDLRADRCACFVEVPLQAYQDYLGTAIWFYAKSPRPFPCLQIVWPDLAGRFPWEVGCDERVKRSQPVLRSFS